MEISSVPLEGRFVRLEPYAEAHREPLRAALDIDPESWSIFAVSGQGDQFDAWWDLHLADRDAGRRVPFVVRLKDTGAVVGSTSLMSIRPRDRGAEIGSTFYRPEVRGGAVNPECKLLLLRHGFDAGAARMELVTDLRNGRSQAAIAKLGALREGVLRRHKLTWTGHIRDTVVFSILEEEWPAVRTGLEVRVAAFG